MTGDRPTVLVAGIGEVGGHLLEFLARSPRPLRIVAGDVAGSGLEAKVHNAACGAAFHGLEPQLEAVEIDLFDVDRTAELLAAVSPHVVVNCAVLQTWHVIRRLPKPLYERISAAGLGAWLPVQLLFALRMAQALERAGSHARYVNTSLSDLTNPVLAAVGPAPLSGVGNVALIASAIARRVASELGLPHADVTVQLVAHHVHWVTWREAGYREGAPFFLEVVVGGERMTDRWDPVELMKASILDYAGGTAFSAVSASSTLEIVLALLSAEARCTHAPGPNGLPGGYPVTVDRSGVEVVLPDTISLDEAIGLNRVAQTYDGVERIDADGRVHFMPYAIDILREQLGFDCASFTPDECEARAREQVARFQELERRTAGG